MDQIEKCRQRLARLAQAQTVGRDQILALLDDEMIQILRTHMPLVRRFLVDRLEYLLRRNDRLAIDIEDAAWRIVDPVLHAGTPVHEYELGTWGPSEASEAVVPPGGWHAPMSGSATIPRETMRAA